MRTWTLSEDWQSTLIGLGIVLAIAFGILGPGSQRVNLSAAPGDTAAADAVSGGGWSVSGTVDGASAPVADAVESLDGDVAYVYTCADGALSATTSNTLPEGVVGPEDGKARIVLVNACDTGATLAYRRATFIPWPIFGLFE
jgi:hypothetical protein